MMITTFSNNVPFGCFHKSKMDTSLDDSKFGFSISCIDTELSYLISTPLGSIDCVLNTILPFGGYQRR
jgi:hypothetical protein